MKLWFWNLVIALLCYSTSCYYSPPAAPQCDGEHAAEQRRRAVRVDVTCETAAGETRNGGSGTIVGPQRIITARHVVDQCRFPRVRIIDRGGLEVAAVVGLHVPGADVVELRIRRGRYEIDPVRLGRAEKGDWVCVSTALPRWLRSCGLVYHTDGDELRSHWIADFGNSGSGVYLESTGEYVGVLTRVTRAPSGQHTGSVIDTRIDPLFAVEGR